MTPTERAQLVNLDGGIQRARQEIAAQIETAVSEERDRCFLAVERTGKMLKDILAVL
jgi:hypothetical protein